LPSGLRILYIQVDAMTKPNKSIIAILVMGFNSLVIEALAIRELLVTFQGNELIIGVVFATWLLLEATGSWGLSRTFANRKPHVSFVFLSIFIALYFPFAIIAARNIRYILGTIPGVLLGPGSAVLAALVVIGPLALADGTQFPITCRLLRQGNIPSGRSTAMSYGLEATGTLAAGFIFTFVLVPTFTAITIAILVGILNLLCGWFLLRDDSRQTLRHFSMALLITGLAAAAILLTEIPDKLRQSTLGRLWTGQTLLESIDSHYSNIAVTRTDSQWTYYSNGTAITALPISDIASDETFVHIAMLAHQNPKNVLLACGGVGGILHQVLKYPVEGIDYAELDPELLNIFQKYPAGTTNAEMSDKRVHLIPIDARKMIKDQVHRGARNIYDIILVNAPEPSSLASNRYYSRQFFGLAGVLLKDNGIFAIRIPGSETYLSGELASMSKSIYTAMKACFPHIRVIPGKSTILLASRNLTLDSFSSKTWEESYLSHGIETEFLTTNNFAYLLSSVRERWWLDGLVYGYQASENSDIRPTALFHYLAWWSALTRGTPTTGARWIAGHGVWLVIALIIVIIAAMRKPALGCISATGFTGMSINLLVLLAFQCVTGYMYQWIALLSGAFMGGISIGSWFGTKLASSKNRMVAVDVIVGLFALGTGLLLFSCELPQAGYITLELGAGFLVGVEFPLAFIVMKRYKDRTNLSNDTGKLYASDLVGAALASLTVPLILLPLTGVLNTCIMLAIAKCGTSIWLATSH